MNLRVNRARARELVLRLNTAFENREGLLAERDDLVENQIPPGVERGTREHALFLFYTVPNDHGVKSSRLYAKAISLFLSAPDLFEPSSVLNRFRGPDDQDLIGATGAALGTRYPKVTARGWFLNSRRLANDFGGDPRNVFTAFENGASLMKLVRSFFGFGPKTGGMLLRAVDGLGMASIADLEEVLLPVDVHDSRISFQTSVVASEDGSVDGDYHRHAPRVQRVLTEACKEANVRWPDVDRALWLIGSRGCVPRRCSECPLITLCAVGSSSEPASLHSRKRPATDSQAQLPWSA